MKKSNQMTIDLHLESLKKIKSNKKTKKISYEDFKSAFDYVDNIFPKSNVKEAEVYMCSRKFLDKIGYKGIGGFYSKVEKIVVIPDSMPDFDNTKSNDQQNSFISKRWMSIKTSVTVEQILVHELLHYVSGKRCDTERSMQIEEEFAYGNMVDFCRMRGKTDEEIIIDIFLPYLFNTIISSKNIYFPKSDEEDRKLFELVMKEAMEIGYRIIKIWDKNKLINNVDKNKNVGNTLNLDLD